MLPEWLHALRIRDLAVAGARLDVAVQDGSLEVRGLPHGIAVNPRTREARTAVHD